MLFRFDEFVLDTDRFELSRAGVAVPAEPQVLELLALLIENRERLVSKEEINDVVWRGRIVSDTALSSRVKTARQLLGDDGRSQRFIRTIHKKGFRFVADVTAVAAAEAGSESRPPPNPPAPVPAAASGERDAEEAGTSSRANNTGAEDAIKVQFFTHSGGQSVAYSVIGSGPALVVPAWWVSHLELDWQQPGFRRFFGALAQHCRVIRYDRPGVGLSDRQRDSFTLDDEVSVLGGLIDHLQLANCALLGISCGGPVAVNYAALHPQRVSRLVLVGSFVHGADIAPAPMQDAICALVSAHWGLGAKAIIDMFNPEMATDSRNAMGRVHRQSASADMATALLQLTFAMDARDAAQGLQVPALVIHHSKDHTVAFDAGRKLASRLGNAQLLTLEGRAHLPWFGSQSREVAEHILAFIGGARESVASEEGKGRRNRSGAAPDEN